MLDFSHIPLSNDFAFSQVMREPDTCQCFLETVLKLKIRKLVFIGKQEDLTDSLLSHGIRLDIYIEDDNSSVYNIEMQNRLESFKRIRYYQSGIDRRTLGKGRDYNTLKTSYIISVCAYDPAGLVYPLYNRVSWLQCPAGSSEYDDGSRVIFLNSRYDPKYREELPEVCEFLDLLNQTGEIRPEAMQFPLGQKAAEGLKRLRQDEEKEAVFMTLGELIEREGKDKFQDGYEKGIQEGRAEGEAKKLEESIQRIMASFNLSHEEAEKILS